MKFTEAIKLIKPGQRIKRKDCSVYFKLYEDGSLKFSESTNGYLLCKHDIEIADDWEVYYEPKTLWQILTLVSKGTLVKRSIWSTSALYLHENGRIYFEGNKGCLSQLQEHDLEANDWILK